MEKKLKGKKGKIKVTKGGPYIATGKLPLAKQIIVADDEGNSAGWKEGEKYPLKESYSLCRCGQSHNKPFCDEMHKKINFTGEETAINEKYDKQAEVLSGPDLNLKDEQDLCSGARFCHRGGGAWQLAENSDNPESKKLAIEEAQMCPSGRLVACDKKTGEKMEPNMEPSLGLIEDPEAKVSGPIAVKGGVTIESADGDEYEIRNRATLCRCGQSHNKPFCDGTHIRCGFDDGDESIK